jgi:hypothetical protein
MKITHQQMPCRLRLLLSLFSFYWLKAPLEVITGVVFRHSSCREVVTELDVDVGGVE